MWYPCNYDFKAVKPVAKSVKAKTNIF